MRDNVYLGLVHYPVYNKRQEEVATSVTNFDIHDISRSCMTYDIKNYYIITPVDAQIELTKRIIGFWQDGDGKIYNNNRNEAFSRTVIMESFEDTVEDITKKEGMPPVIVSTSAKKYANNISYDNLNKIIYNNERPIFLIFGTGWGLSNKITDRSDYILDPIRGEAKYNHLSVRSAVSIILDRLFGEE